MKSRYTEKLWFPVRVWEFRSDPSLLNRALLDMETTVFRSYNPDGGVGTSFPHLESYPQWQPLTKWFEKCANELLHDNGWIASGFV